MTSPIMRRLPASIVSSVIAGALMLVSPVTATASQATRQLVTESADPASGDGRAVYDDRVTEITVSPLEAFPGGVVHVTGVCTLWGFAADYVHISFAPADDSVPSVLADVPIDSVTGLIDADVIVPSDLPPGPHTLGWMCAADDMAFGGHETRIPFTVLGPAPTEAPATPPATPPVGSAEAGDASEPAVVKDAATETLADTGFPNPATGLIVFGVLTAVGSAFAVLVRRRSTARERR